MKREMENCLTLLLNLRQTCYDTKNNKDRSLEEINSLIEQLTYVENR